MKKRMNLMHLSMMAAFLAVFSGCYTQLALGPEDEELAPVSESSTTVTIDGPTIVQPIIVICPPGEPPVYHPYVPDPSPSPLPTGSANVPSPSMPHVTSGVERVERPAAVITVAPSEHRTSGDRR